MGEKDSNQNDTPADEKALALTFAYTALVRTLCKNGNLNLEDLMGQLVSASHRLDQIGETGSAHLLEELTKSLRGVDQ